MSLLFGYKNLKWAFKELVKLYSNEASYFSKKRVESGIAFFIAEAGAIYFLISKIEVMTATDFGIWIGFQFVIVGYTVNQIQKEKENDNPGS